VEGKKVGSGYKPGKAGTVRNRKRAGNLFLVFDAEKKADKMGNEK
jgi:hypothetical protein